MDLTERQPPKVNLPDPISISKLFPAKAIRQPDGAETRIEQKHQLGRHFVEIRRWRLEGADWTPTPDKEVDDLIKLVKKKLKRLHEVNGNLQKKILPGLRAQLEIEATKFMQR